MIGPEANENCLSEVVGVGDWKRTEWRSIKTKFLHRLSGPAVVWTDGEIEWWINGNPKEYAEWIEDPIRIDWLKERLFFL